MVELCVKDNIFYTADIEFDALLNILLDNFILPSTYISLNLSEGGRLAVKKESISVIAEVMDNQDA